jgi:hypothetical protein
MIQDRNRRQQGQECSLKQVAPDPPLDHTGFEVVVSSAHYINYNMDDILYNRYGFLFISTILEYMIRNEHFLTTKNPTFNKESIIS